ncbi:MAG: protein translocase subunit SecD [Angustibacter sp.]
MLAVVVLGLFAWAFGQAQWADGAQATPRLGLDLAGGTRVVLTPVVTEGGQQLTQEALTQSRDIIEARVNGSGVAEAEITTESGRNIVVAVPGRLTDRQRDLITRSSQMRFRVVLVREPVQIVPPTATATPSGSGKPSGSATPSRSAAQPSGSATSPTARSGRSSTPDSTQSPRQRASSTQDQAAVPFALERDATSATTSSTRGSSPTGSASPTSPPGTASPAPSPTSGAKPTDASDLAQITPSLQRQFEQLDCADTSKIQGSADDPAKPLVTCSQDRTEKYILGPAEVSGTDIEDASAGLQPTQTGGSSTTWEVRLDLDDKGGKAFSDVTTRIWQLPEPRNRFGIVLDGLVISAPSADEPITAGSASITGSFTQASSQELANQVRYGGLPLSFRTETSEEISPLLGAEQLQRGLLAGGIGMILVVLYSLLQYRALGLVTVASLVVGAAITYTTVIILSNTNDLRLTLAGITGLIVSIGVTADSFIVYFERVRDEVREGRSLRSAVELGWKRAFRTIMAADAINFLAAAVLYLLADGSVRGFAYMLGLATIIDVLVVVLFTHPLLTLVARVNFFAQGHRLSGLDPERLGRGLNLGVKARLGDAASTIASRRAAAAAASSPTPRDA